MTDAPTLERPAPELRYVAATPPKAKPAVSRKTLLSVGAAVAVAVGGGLYIAAPKGSVSTDAAYVEADSAIIAPKVKGLVARVLVAHNQAVHRGDPLVEIDPEEFDAHLASANADLQNARAAEGAARAALTSLAAEERLAAANVHAAQTMIRAADAQSARAAADQKRYDTLDASGFVTHRDVEQVRATAASAASAADRSRADLEVTEDAQAVTAAKRATLEANLAQATAAVRRAAAALDLARQDQGHTLVRAPIEGVVGDRQVQAGDYVQPGARMMTVVPMDAVYVTANFKETQTGRMLAGQPATLKIDALPGVTLRGHVDSFAPGSGSQFSLLPFEPGTGNFTKIVQRVPVRIRFDPGQPEVARLRPGLSTTVTVKTGG
jgi:membrane fusion protein (multidrug efflux system)